MSTLNLITLVSLLIALSGAAERLTEIVKGLIPFLNQENEDPVKEARRKSSIQFLAVISGIVTAILSSPVIEPVLQQLVGGNNQNWNAAPSIFALGLLSSFGAAFWNSILEYLLKVKDIKEVMAKKLKETTTGNPPANNPVP